MKNLFRILLATVIFLSSFTFLVGCDNNIGNDVIYLNVYNCEDYISEGEEFDTVLEFEKHCLEKYGKKVVVNYSTFGTNENMYNELQLSKVKNKDGSYSYAYDLVCTSDYMIQKMMVENMLEKYDFTLTGSEGGLENYTTYVSSYITKLFADNGWTDYACAYMYGTMGFVYNPEVLKENGNYQKGDELSWDLPWKAYSKNLGTIKDSIRDTYALALGYVYTEELKLEREKYLDILTQNQNASEEVIEQIRKDYNNKVVEIFNRTDEETVEKATNALTTLKGNVYGFEVDSGKKDMASGKIAINFAWSGDAVYTLDLAEQAGTTLYYAVPEYGSNIWFDGWVMPKGANVTLAQEFINFISSPENAIHNMNYIGYTPAIAGEEMFNNCVDWYGKWTLIECDENEEDAIFIDGKYYLEYYFGDLDESQLSQLRNADGSYNLIVPVYDDNDEVIGLEVEEGVIMYEHDASLLLRNSQDEKNKNYVVWTDTVGRQLETQYPTEEVVTRCAIMKYFNNEEMKRLNDMWDNVKIAAVPTWLMVLVVAIIVILLITVPLFTYLNKKGVTFNFKIKNKNLTPISREIIKK